MRLILFFFFFSKFTFSQYIDELVFYNDLPAERTYSFKLEKTLLIDAYDFYSVYTSNNPIDLTTIKMPEFVNSENIILNIYNKRKSIQSIPNNSFESVLTKENSVDYISSRIGSLIFEGKGRATLNGTPLVFKVVKLLNTDSFGNQLYKLKMSTSIKTVELPIFRIFDSYKMVLNYHHLKFLGIDIVEDNTIPFEMNLNDKKIEQKLTIRSISYELRRNPKYFESYTIVPSIHSIIRTDIFNDNFLNKSISKEHILFIFDLIER